MWVPAQVLCLSPHSNNQTTHTHTHIYIYISKICTPIWVPAQVLCLSPHANHRPLLVLDPRILIRNPIEYLRTNKSTSKSYSILIAYFLTVAVRLSVRNPMEYLLTKKSHRHFRQYLNTFFSLSLSVRLSAAVLSICKHTSDNIWTGCFFLYYRCLCVCSQPCRKRASIRQHIRYKTFRVGNIYGIQTFKISNMSGIQTFKTIEAAHIRRNQYFQGNLVSAKF